MTTLDARFSVSSTSVAAGCANPISLSRALARSMNDQNVNASDPRPSVMALPYPDSVHDLIISGLPDP